MGVCEVWVGRVGTNCEDMWCEGRGVIRRNVCGEKDWGDVPELRPQVGGQDPEIGKWCQCPCIAKLKCIDQL